ncbi:hypothetical protein [Ruania alba]|uniref:ParB/Sulfiredoxin domain-containing protein n=1 Tax=Ruania alba TaxID=648782 RepID=A0A1H5MRD1_9MICO|nr:hypothetical protein [Ruania alba]SEE91935.1 hypothetical protein SAMN04488554_3585 [Ruania alba]
MGSASGADRSAPDVTREELLRQTPPAIRAAFGDEAWRLEDLWAITGPVTRVSVTALDWLLDLPLWQRDGMRFQVSPREVLNVPDQFPDHLARVRAVDVTFPVHAVRRSHGVAILDGYHRLLSTILDGGTSVPAIVLSPAQLASISG